MPAVGNRNPISVQYLDGHSKVQSTRMYAGNITAVTIAGFLSDFGTLQNALDAVTLGVRSAQTWGEESQLSNTPPSDDNASVATEILVRYRGATTQKPYSFRIPTADYAAFNYAPAPNADSILIGDGATAATTALIAAMEALLKTPDDNTEGIVVTGMNIVE